MCVGYSIRRAGPYDWFSNLPAGYYKPDPVAEYTEESPGGDHDFLSKLCTKWEAASNLPPSVNCRNVVVRSGASVGFESRCCACLKGNQMAKVKRQRRGSWTNLAEKSLVC